MIFQMAKRKRTSLTSTRSKKIRRGNYWENFGRSFFGTLSDPLGTVVSLIKGQQPSWNQRGKGIIERFDHRRGFIGGFLSSMGTNYLKQMLEGAIGAATRKEGVKKSILSKDPRLLAYKLIHRNAGVNDIYFHNPKSTFQYLPFDIRNNGISDTLYNIYTNPTVRQYGKKAAVLAATYAIPRALDYILNKNNKRVTRSSVLSPAMAAMDLD